MNTNERAKAAITCHICDRPDQGNEGDPCRQCEDEFWSDPLLVVLDDEDDFGA